MTTIVGLVHEDRVYIAGDSCAVYGDNLVRVRTDPKVFKVKNMLIGFTSSYRMGQILRYMTSLPLHTKTQTPYEYLATKFVDFVRELFEEKKFVTPSSEEGGTFLIGYKKQLFSIEPDFQVGQYKDGFQAVGSGQEIALGSLYTSREWPDPEKRAIEALTAASIYTNGTRPPFTIEYV